MVNVSRLTRIGLVLAVLATTVVAVGSPASAARRLATYEVTVTNTTDGQYLTPPNWAAHSRRANVFDRRRPASPGVQAVAENGGVPVLAAELKAAIDDRNLGISGVGLPSDPEAADPIAPGESRTFQFSSARNRFSMVAMIVCTNDGFGGLDARRLPKKMGKSKRFRLRAYDAGTEINTEMRKDIVPAPFCGEGEGATMSNSALDEGGVVRFHRTLRNTGDLDPALDWSGPVGSVKVTRIG